MVVIMVVMVVIMVDMGGIMEGADTVGVAVRCMEAEVTEAVTTEDTEDTVVVIMEVVVTEDTVEVAVTIIRTTQLTTKWKQQNIRPQNPNPRLRTMLKTELRLPP